MTRRLQPATKATTPSGTSRVTWPSSGFFRSLREATGGRKVHVGKLLTALLFNKEASRSKGAPPISRQKAPQEQKRGLPVVLLFVCIKRGEGRVGAQSGLIARPQLSPPEQCNRSGESGHVAKVLRRSLTVAARPLHPCPLSGENSTVEETPPTRQSSRCVSSDPAASLHNHPPTLPKMP